MIATTEQLMQEQIREAIEQAYNDGKTKLVSLVKKARSIDPLIFYLNGNAQFCGQRFFWKDPDRKYTLVGLGHSYVLSTERKEDRFSYVESEWKYFMENDVFCSESVPHATGPVLFGGFSFDPEQQQEEKWSDFPSSKFIVPTFLYTIAEDEIFFTANITVHGNDDVHSHVCNLEKIENDLFKFNPSLVMREDIPYSLKKYEIGADYFKRSVSKTTERIKQQEVEKVVLSRRLKVDFNQPIQNEEVINRLIAEQPTSYIYAFENDNSCFIGASPERLIKRSSDNVYSTCLAGSIRRGTTKEEDIELGIQLLNDEKNLVEHEVVVHAIKEAMMSYCDLVELPSSPALYKTKHIQHLYTPVTGKVNKDVTLFSFIKMLHPTPALGGYPQQKALSIIQELEDFDRGWYAGPIGWMDAWGNGEFIVGIRSGLIQEEQALLFAGCGIVADSDPESEYEETKIKFNPMLSALGGIANGTH